MSKTVTGRVSRTGKSKYSYFVMLDGEEFYYNTKFEPKCSEGDEVMILFDQKADNRGNIKKIKITKAGSGGSKSSGGWSGGKSSGGDNRQDSIVWQHSQEMAISYVGELVSAGLLELKGKGDAKLAQLDAFVDLYTYRFFKDAMAPTESAVYKSFENSGSDSGSDEDEWGDSDDSSNDDWDDWD